MTETIWIGKMNHIGRMRRGATPDLIAALEAIAAGQTDEIILKIHGRHQANPQIRWKESITKVVASVQNEPTGN
jgi:hypothetical protein